MVFSYWKCSCNGNRCFLAYSVNRGTDLCLGSGSGGMRNVKLRKTDGAVRLMLCRLDDGNTLRMLWLLNRMTVRMVLL